MLTLAYGRIDQVLVFQIAGTDAAGLYGAMYRILNTAAFVPMAVMTTLFPVLSAVELPEMRRLVQLADRVPGDGLAADLRVRAGGQPSR